MNSQLFLRINISFWFAVPGLSTVKNNRRSLLFNAPSGFRDKKRLHLLHNTHMCFITGDCASFRAGSIRIPAFFLVRFPPGTRISQKYMRKLSPRDLAGPSPCVPGTVPCNISALYFVIGSQLRIEGVNG